jgi:hypothetical protein
LGVKRCESFDGEIAQNVCKRPGAGNLGLVSLQSHSLTSVSLQSQAAPRGSQVTSSNPGQLGGILVSLTCGGIESAERLEPVSAGTEQRWRAATTSTGEPG